MKIGRKLAMKVLNVSKFVLAGEQPEGAVTEPLDRGMLQNLATVVDDATTELENYEYAKALAKIESFFWDFCDNYIEAAKSRRYGDFGPSRGVRRQRRCGWRCRCCCGCWPRICPLRARKCGRGPTAGSIHRARGRRARSSCACRVRRIREEGRASRDRSVECDPQGQGRSEGLDRHAGASRCLSGHDEAIACLSWSSAI
jgi:hypothetical protein